MLLVQRSRAEAGAWPGRGAVGGLDAGGEGGLPCGDMVPMISANDSHLQDLRIQPPRRRTLLSGGAAWIASTAALPAWAGPTGRVARLAAAWDDTDGRRHHAGLLEARGDVLRVLARIELPSRAHGLCAEPGGSVLVVARRPGDWLLRWQPRSGAAQWLWSDAGRCFTGHVARLPGQPLLCAAETDLDTGLGLLATRHPQTLALQAEWPTGGIDPHQMLADADGSVLVANGGILTLPETGRAKHDLDRMDPSLVRLDPRTGRCLGQWRLHDPRLSIRHLARHAGGTIGAALQAEHDDAGEKARAPVLALFDGQSLRSVPAPRPLAGYGGDIAATAEGFCVSVPRAGGVAHWTAEGGWRGLQRLPGACALASGPDGLWAGGHDSAARWSGPGAAGRPGPPRLKLDNHWVVLAA